MTPLLFLLYFLCTNYFQTSHLNKFVRWGPSQWGKDTATTFLRIKTKCISGLGVAAPLTSPPQHTLWIHSNFPCTGTSVGVMVSPCNPKLISNSGNSTKYVKLFLLEKQIRSINQSIVNQIFQIILFKEVMGVECTSKAQAARHGNRANESQSLKYRLVIFRSALP